MKSIKKIAAAMAILAATGTASAGVIDSAGVATAVTHAQPYSYSHVIFDQGFVAGRTIASAILTIVVNDPLKGSELFQLTIGSQVYKPSDVNKPNHANNGTTTTFEIPLDASSLLDLKDGTIDLVADTDAEGNYTFLNSALAFDLPVAAPLVEAPQADVPEPFTLGLMGIGVGGVAMARRRKLR